MIQAELFPQNPIARKSDPISSHLSAYEITASGIRGTQQTEIMFAAKKYPGRTSRELAGHTGLDRYIVARRLPELESVGLVYKGDARKCRVADRMAVVWWPVN